MAFFGQLLKGKGFFKMQIDITPDRGALAVCGYGLGFRGDGKAGGAHKANDQNFHVGLANILIAGVFLLHLPEDISETAGYFHTFIMIQNIKLSVGRIPVGKLDAVNTENDVFQRLGIEADLCMDNDGIDDHQLIDTDRVELIFNQELTFATHNEEQFHMIMGVGNGMPVAAVSGTGRVQQFCGASNGKALLPV